MNKQALLFALLKRLNHIYNGNYYSRLGPLHEQHQFPFSRRTNFDRLNAESLVLLIDALGGDLSKK